MKTRDTRARQAKAEYAGYYQNSLLYLACIDPAEDLTAGERVVRAHDLCLAAVLGETVYHFGELVRPTHSVNQNGDASDAALCARA